MSSSEPSAPAGVETPAPVPQAPSFLATAASGGCGCLAFVAGAALAIALFAPRMLAGWAERVVERDLSSVVDGRVVVEGLSPQWRSPQTARNVELRTPDGELLVEGALTLPSLFDLFAHGGQRGTYALHARRLYCRVDEDGGSDLARAFRLDVDSGETALARLRSILVESARGSNGPRQHELRFDLRVGEALFEQSGAEPVTLHDVDFSARAHRLGTTLDLGACRLGWEGEARRAEVSARLVFDADGTPTAIRAQSDALPAEVLRALGWRPRAAAAAEEFLSADDPYAAGGTAVRAAFAGLLEPGCSLLLEYGPGEVEEGAAAPDPHALTLRLEGASGRLALDARLAGEPGAPMLVPRPGVALPLRFELPVSLYAIAPLFEGLAPEGATVQTSAGVSRLRGGARSFRIPVADTGPEGLAGADVAATLRDSDLALELATAPGTVPLGVRFGPVLGDDALELEHGVTRIQVLAGLGGSLRSVWSTSGDRRRTSVFTVKIPGAPLASFAAPPAHLDLDVRDVPREFVARYASLPEVVRDLLTTRFDRFAVSGIPLTAFAGGAAARSLRLNVRAVTSAGETIEGELRGMRFRAPESRFTLDLGRTVVRDALITRTMPWIASTRPYGEERTVQLTMKGFEFDLDADGSRPTESGRLTLVSDPLEVRLARPLAERLGLDPSAWILWRPGPLELDVDRSAIRYLAVELPLEDEEAAPMTGQTLGDAYSLEGDVERRLAPGLPDNLALEVIPVSIQGSRERATVSTDVSVMESILERFRVGR